MTSDSIMIIDDDKDIRDSLVEVLELEGYQVLEADNGKSGLDLLLALPDENRPALIFLDLRMPVMDGLGFLKERNGKHPDLKKIPVVISTANTSNADSLEAQNYADDFLRKPLDLSKLYEVVERYCPRSADYSGQV